VTSSGTRTISHIYDEPGIYVVSVTVIDSIGNTSQSRVIIEITGRIDSDGDGVYDDTDICPLVR
jgi:PKD repeat protein